MAEWLKATVLKTVDGSMPSVGSNPTLSATFFNFAMYNSILYSKVECFEV